MAALAIKHECNETLEQIETHYDAFKFLRGLASQFGFERFLIATLPELDETLSEQTLLTNWDAELLQIYDEKFLAQRGSVWPAFQNSTVPASLSATAKFPHRLHFDLAERTVLDAFGIRSVTMIPLRSAARRPLIVSLCSSSDQPLNQPALAEILYPLVQLGDRLEQIKGNTTKASIVLSERETECLRWTAHGKTSVEIAAILSLSEHTVNHYLAGAGRKLNAVSRPHAVANALRHGLIN